MKYTKEEKQNFKDKEVIQFIPFKKEEKQVYIQDMIDSHYPVTEKYEVYESKINQ